MDEYAILHKIEFELCGGNLPEEYKAFVRRVLNDRNLIPAAPVAPVVRCKDCAHLVAANVNGKGIPTCRVSGMEVALDEFCSRGKKGQR